MKLKSIYIDGLHNAVDKTYEFNDLVYFFGRNGAGKTTVLNAIQLGLLGYIPGTAKNSREALLRHSRAEKIVVRLVLDDNGNLITIERKYDSKSGKTTVIPEDFDIQSVISDIELPIFNFNEFVGQTANKLKDYFIQNILPETNGKLDWRELLKSGLFNITSDNMEELLNYGMNLIAYLPTSDSMLDQVIAANKRFKEEQTYYKAELSRLQATVDSLIYYSDYVGPKDLNELDTKLLSLGAIRDSLLRYESALRTVEHGVVELNLAESKLLDMGGTAQYQELTKSLNSNKAQYDEILRQMKDLEISINACKDKRANLQKMLTGGCKCPYTKDICTSMDISAIEAQMSELGIKLDTDSTNWHILNDQLSALKDKINQQSSTASEFIGIQNRIEALRRSLATLPEKPNTDKTLQEIDIEIQKYSEDRDKLKANIAYETTIENITKLKYKSELNSAALAAWIKLTDTNGLQTTLAEKPFENLADRMTSYIQTMYGNTDLKAKFNLSTKANSFSFGLVRNAKYISYDQLSSGEKCLYTLALMLCIIDNSKSPLKLMLCDDMFDHLDSVAVENTFSALKNIPDIQFILAGVKECHNAEEVMIRL